jgi:hypothetical protein
LIIDATYEGGDDFTKEPLTRMFGCANMSGFRPVSDNMGGHRLIILYTSFADIDWPDTIDVFGGELVYYGDNKKPGHDLHAPKGNRILRRYFEDVHNDVRNNIPPFFVFSKGVKGRDVVFKGLAVPSGNHLTSNDDLVAIWKIRDGERFQNYRAIFTILDASAIDRQWINDLLAGIKESAAAPEAWNNWRSSGVAEALVAQPVTNIRNKSEQLPVSLQATTVLDLIYSFYKDDPFGFEKCAKGLIQLMDMNVIDLELTRPYRDGGRDAVGLYSIGHGAEQIEVEFAMEAKCYATKNSVGVREMSRLISRLRYRQFGILVTTSYVHEQAYKEIKDDGHPVLVLSGKDIVEILRKNGFNTPELVSAWLNTIR